MQTGICKPCLSEHDIIQYLIHNMKLIYTNAFPNEFLAIDP